jgi:amino acid adenylation domain-containing protein
MHSFTLSKIFESQVKKSPEKIAIKFEKEQLTYQQLNERANQLAHLLIKNDVKLQSLVSIQLKRSPELIIAILAVLKVGSAYVPLDAICPQKRLEFILEDTKPSYFISPETFLDPFLLKMPNYNPEIKYSSDSLANIMYTSGSTGTPKGVMITHRNIYQLFKQTEQLFRFNENDIWSLFHSFGFDVSVWEIWGAFFHGGSLIIIPEDIVRSIGDFYEIISQEKMTVLCQTPSVFKHLIHYESELECQLPLNLRYVILAGEALNPTMLKPWFEKHGNSTAIVNMYGITETTIHSTFYLINNISDTRSIIGRPIPGTQIHLLDQKMQPVTPGTPGEIHLSGDGVAKGYWNNPELTKEKFLDNQIRLYKSGDIAIYHQEEGVYEYLYRGDDQIKIRGYRIETNEIEQCILQFENIKDVKVIARQMPSEEKQLIAFLIPSQEMLPKWVSTQFINSLREHIRPYLPEYMIPVQFALIKEFPLNHNGKLDKRKLLDSLHKHEPESIETIHGLFERQVEKTPNTPAIQFEDEFLTFKDLNSKANQVAHYLLHIGAKKQVLIGLCMERTANALIVILGIFKAGCIYVPIHPDRLELISNEIQPLLVFTDLTFKNLWSTISSMPVSNLNIEIDPQAAAYIIYTSGSTGSPKGVMGHHRGLLNRFHWMWQQWPFEDLEKCCQKTSFYFVDSFWEIFGPLLKGILLVIVPQAVLQDLEEFISFLAHNAITRIVLVPSLLKAMLDHKDVNQLKQLNTWTSSGEILPVAVVQRFQEIFPQAILLNIYGSSEVAADVTCFEAHLWIGETKSIPIGKPISNIKIHLLNSDYQSVQEDEVGELFVEGAGVALGYYKKPEITDQFFVYISGKRLYKTGDFGRRLTDGNIEYLGRRDRQIKIRGIRVELGEIESALLKHSAIKNCVIIPDDQLGLRAFVVLRESVERKELHLHLKTLIPEYMLPNEFVFLKKLPLNPNGKIDCIALKNISPEKITAFKIPQNTIEKIISNVWSELLDVSEIGSEDNFFHLGGHSLLATQLISRLKRIFRKDISIRLIFDYPKLSDLATHIGLLPSFTKAQVTKRSENHNIPLSFAQQRLWFIEKYIAQQNIYNVFRAYSLNGCLNLKSLQYVLNQIINRHEILRTSFCQYNDTVFQCITPEVKIELEILQELDIEGFTKENFDLVKAPLIRVKLVKISERHHMLLLAMHHMITDGWSVNILLKELNALYDTQNHLESPPLQYADFTIWQQKQLDKLDYQLNYWKKQLKDVPNHTYVPYDYPPIKSQSYLSDRCSFMISQEELTHLKLIGDHSQATLFMVLLAAFQVLLHRYSDYEDIVIGSTIANRHWEEFEEIMGPFANTIILRNQCHGSMSFQDFLEQVRDTTLQAYYNQDYPFDKLVEAIPESRSLDQHPFFKIMFVYNVIAHPLALKGLSCKELEIKQAYTPFDLTTLINESSNGLEVKLEFATEKFKRSTIERMAGHLHTLLQCIIENPHQIISQLNLLPEDEKKQLQAFGNCYETASKKSTIVELFAEQVKKSPDAIALIYENEQMSYRELDKESDHVAKQLSTMKITPDSVVAISQDRSLKLVVYLLGILKAGAAYLFLDPSWPQERKELILNDIRPRVVITDSFDGSIHDNCITLPPEPHHLAYVIYTSGSTGRPKGVMIEHQAICDRLIWCKNNFNFSIGKRVLHMYSFSFDASVLFLWWPLIVGSSVVITTSIGMRDPEYLRSLLKNKKINMCSATPSQLELIFDGKESFNSLQTVIAGGEVLNKKLLKNLLSKVTDVVNFYGPTESAVIATFWQAQLDEDLDIIGKPVGNAQIHILDKNKNEVPIGSKGEIYISGVGLARGYWNNPKMNSEHFFEHPVKMYKTGDVGRFLEDGNIEFLGRRDRQIKLYGHRIELNEIETCLRRHPSVKEAQVNLTENKWIEAYILLKKPKDIVPDIRQYLSNQLPSYMVPRNIKISNIILNDHGKLDLKSLATEIDIPLTSLEKQLVIIWKKLLNLPKIDIHHNIFHLGATSILCVKASLLAKQFGQLINVRQFFEYPTIASLAKAMTNDTNNSVVPIQEQGNETPLFLIHPGLGLIFPYKVLSKYFTSSPIYAIENPRFAGIHTPYTSLKEMAIDYVDLILKKQPEGPYRLGGWSFGGNVALEIAQRLANLNQKVDHVLMIDSYCLSENTNHTIEHSPELWSIFEEEILNNINLAKSYKPLTYSGKITLLQAEESKSSIANGWDLSIYPSMKVFSIAGKHSCLFEEPFVKEIVPFLNF